MPKSNIITFPRMKIGEIVELEVDNTRFKAKILKHIRKDIYEVIALKGPYKGKIATLEIRKWKTEEKE